MFLCMQVATIAWFEADSVCGSHSVAIPLVLVLPYLFRFFQCLRQYRDIGERSALLNGMSLETFPSKILKHIPPPSPAFLHMSILLLVFTHFTFSKYLVG